MRELHQPEAGVRILGLGVGEEGTAPVQEYCRERDLKFPVALAPNSVLADYGHVHGVPVTFLIDAQGQIRRRFDGVRDLHTYRAAIAAIRARG